MWIALLSALALCAPICASPQVFSNADQIPKELIFEAVKKIVRDSPRVLGSLCKFRDPNEQPKFCTCEDGNVTKLDAILEKAFKDEAGAWKLWKCFPTTCTCQNDVEVPVPRRTQVVRYKNMFSDEEQRGLLRQVFPQIQKELQEAGKS